MNFKVFYFASCGRPMCSDLEFHRGGHEGLVEMCFELGIDLQNKELREELNDFFAQRFGPDRVVIVTWPADGAESDGKYDYSGLSTSRGPHTFFFRRLKEDRVTGLAIVALVGMFAGMRISTKS